MGIDHSQGVSTEAIEKRILECLTGRYALSPAEITLRLVDFSSSTVSYQVRFPAGELVEQEVRDTLLRSVMALLPGKKTTGEALS